VPLIANWPGRIPAGTVNRDLIGGVDFLPTLCEAAGVQVPLRLDGRSFLPQLLGQTGRPREWLYSWYSRDGGPTASHEYATSTNFKLYRDGRFFDLRKDWFEEEPLSVSTLGGPSADAARKLQSVLDYFKDARPSSVWQPWAPVRRR
jgi:arylsulfatase A